MDVKLGTLSIAPANRRLDLLAEPVQKASKKPCGVSFRIIRDRGGQPSRIRLGFEERAVEW